MDMDAPYCENCHDFVPYLMSNGFTDPWGRDVSELWCWDCIDNYDPTPWAVNSEENWPRDAAHRMEEARLVK